MIIRLQDFAYVTKKEHQGYRGAAAKTDRVDRGISDVGLGGETPATTSVAQAKRAAVWAGTRTAALINV